MSRQDRRFNLISPLVHFSRQNEWEIITLQFSAFCDLQELNASAQSQNHSHLLSRRTDIAHILNDLAKEYSLKGFQPMNKEILSKRNNKRFLPKIPRLEMRTYVYLGSNKTNSLQMSDVIFHRIFWHFFALHQVWNNCMQNNLTFPRRKYDDGKLNTL